MRSPIKSSLLACLVAGPLAACATAPPPPLDYVPPTPGLVVVYSHVADGKGDASKPDVVQTIVRNDGDTVVNVVDSKSDGWVRENRTLRAVVTDRIYQRGAGVIEERLQADNIRALWPLAPGKKATSTGVTMVGRGRTEKVAMTRLRRTGSVDYTFEVLRREKVTLPAGTFDTVVFRRVSTVRDLKRRVTLVSDKTYWVALDIGWLVRLDTVNVRPGRPSTEARMIAIEVKRPAAKK